MSDTSITIGQARPQTFEANSQPLETTTMGINFDSDNDFRTELQIPNGPKIYVRPDQVDAMRTRIDTSARQDTQLHPESEPRNVTITVDGQSHTMTGAQFRQMLSGHGTYGGT